MGNKKKRGSGGEWRRGWEWGGSRGEGCGWRGSHWKEEVAESLEADGLGDESLESGGGAFAAVFGGDGGGHWDDAQVGPEGEEVLGGFKAIHDGHLEIKQDDGDFWKMLERVDGFLAAGGEEGREAEAFEEEGSDLEVGGIVIDEEDGGEAFRWWRVGLGEGAVGLWRGGEGSGGEEIGEGADTERASERNQFWEGRLVEGAFFSWGDEEEDGGERLGGVSGREVFEEGECLEGGKEDKVERREGSGEGRRIEA